MFSKLPKKTLIGCLAKTGQDQYLTLCHILFYKVFFDKKHSKTPGKYLRHQL